MKAATFEAIGEAAVAALEAELTTVSRASLLMEASMDFSALWRTRGGKPNEVDERA